MWILDKRVVKAITEEIKNSEYVHFMKLYFFGRVASYKRKISLDKTYISEQYICDNMFDYYYDMLWCKHFKK